MKNIQGITVVNFMEAITEKGWVLFEELLDEAFLNKINDELPLTPSSKTVQRSEFQ